MPVHNGELFLRQAVESVLTQSYRDFEFIIVNNCSTDSSSRIINSFQDKRIIIVNEQDCHPVAAYNRGFTESKGDIIFIADQDDICDPERINNQLEYIEKTNADICGSFINIIDIKGKTIGRLALPVKNEEIKNDLLFKNYTIFNSSVCLRKEIFQSIGYFEKEYFPSADYEFFLRAVRNFNFCNVPQYLYSWRKHPSQISAGKLAAQKSTMRISFSYLDNTIKNKSSGEYFLKKGLVYYYNDHLLKSLFYFLNGIFAGKINKKLIRYILIILILGLPLKLYRKSDLIYSDHFKLLKKIFDRIIRL